MRTPAVKMNDSTHRRSIALAVACVACPVATAQQAEPTQTLERVEVVGSRIPRIDLETALPVQIITRKDIEASGVQTAEDLLARVSANVAANVAALSIGDESRPGFSGASLRGLGATTTLVLLNGRRLSNYAFSYAEVGVDLHTIPLAAVERVEILKDGASALYGTDAIGGVINFVLRNDYQGAEVTLHRGLAEAAGGGEARQTAVFGFGDPAKQGWNVFAVLDHSSQGSLAARERSFSATAFRPADGLAIASTRAAPGNISVGGGQFANPAAPGCGETTVFSRGGCLYDYPKQTDDIPRAELGSLFSRATWQASPDVQVFAEALHAQHRMILRVAATPIDFVSTGGIVQIDVPTTSPFYPQGLGLTGDLTDIHYRSVALGPRTTEVKADNDRTLVGAKGRISGWDFDAGAALASSQARYSYVSGIVDSNALAAAFASGLIDPFGDSGPAGDALLASTQVHGLARTARGTTRTVDAHASREIAALPAGPLSLAVGVEWRGESLDDIAEPISGNVAGSGGVNPPKHGSRQVDAAFVEIDAAIAHGVEAQLAARDDRYSDFGNTLNPKAALRWQPARELLLRASWGKGFRAPTLPELDTAQATTIATTEETGDPLRCPITKLDSDCFPFFVSRYGGNPALRPVTSTQSNVGIVLQPTKEVSASVDYWRIRLRNNIGTLSLDNILGDGIPYQAQFVVRGPVDPNFPTLPGPIVQIDNLNQNLGRVETSGFDVSAHWRSAATPWGRFDASLDGTYVTQFRAQLDGTNFSDALGTSIAGFVIPRWRHDVSLGWEMGAWTLSANERFQNGYHDAHPDGTGQPRRVASYSLCDLQAAYAASKSFTLTVGVRNAFDHDPPLTNQTDHFQVGYDPLYADPRGRFWYVTAALHFR